MVTSDNKKLAHCRLALMVDGLQLVQISAFLPVQMQKSAKFLVDFHIVVNNCPLNSVACLEICANRSPLTGKLEDREDPAGNGLEGIRDSGGGGHK